MTGHERTAYELGKTYTPKSEDQNAPVWDARMDKLVIDAKSEAGCEYNHRIITAWWRGRYEAGSDIPKWMKEEKQA